MRRIAIPVSNNEVNENFGDCNHYEIFDLVGDAIKRKVLEIPLDIDAEGLPKWLKKQGVTDVIVYKVKRNIISLFAANKVNLFVGVSNKSSEIIIDEYLQGKLVSDKNIIREITNNSIY